MSDLSAFLPGSHLFIVPSAPSLVETWRTPRDITLTLEVGDGMSVVGIPQASNSYRTVYELMFVQLALGTDMLAQGTGGGQPFGMYGLRGAEYSSSDQIESARQAFSLILADLMPIYGALQATSYPVIFHRIAGGMEGTHSFVCRWPHMDQDTIQAMILAHEAIHHVLGVRCGEWDDPWWKEGTTYYLGYAVATRLGLVSKGKIHHELTSDLDFSETEQHLAPSSEYVRDHLYVEELYNVVYRKGARIAMLMDLAVRMATGNRERLDEVTASLCRRFDGSAFRRAQFIEHFAQQSGADISSVLERFADAAGPVPKSLLADAFAKLDTLGAFGPAPYQPLAKMSRQPKRDFVVY
jgi:hypothetical protein